MGFGEEQRKARLTRLTHLFAPAVSEVYRNRIVVNNINKLQNINGDINGMPTSPFSHSSSIKYC
jgi:hypothetical protein